MKKHLVKALAGFLALALLLSMSAMTFAATVPVTYYCTVTKTLTETETSKLSQGLTVHETGTATRVDYSVAKQVYEFETSVFPALFRDQLLEAYTLEGFVEELTIPAQSSYMTVTASSPSGAYSVVLQYTSGDGRWEVAPQGSAAVDGGDIVSAPMSYVIWLVRDI